MPANTRRIGSRQSNYSNDSDCEILEPEKLQLDQSKDRQQLLDSTYERDTLLKGSSGSGIQSNSKKKSDRKGTNMNKNINIKSERRPLWRWNTCEYKKSDSSSARNFKNDRKKSIDNKENSAKRSLPSRYANETFLRNSRIQKIDPNRSVKKAINTSNGKCLLEEKKGSIAHLKSEIKRITNDVKLIFSTFTSQLLQLQLKLFQDATQQDAGNIVFMYNCIISKLKEELTEKQQDLTNSYTGWNKKYKCDCVASSKQYKRYTCNNCLQIQSEQRSESNVDNEILSATADKKHINKRTGSSKKKGLKNNKEIQQNIMNNEEGSSSETTDYYLSSPEMERKHILRKNKDACISLDNLSEINSTRLPSKTSMTACKTKQNSMSNTETPVTNCVGMSEKQVHKVHDYSKKPKGRIPEYITDNDSDVSSTWSTIVLCPAIPANLDGKTAVDMYGDELKSLENTSLAISVNDVQHQVLALSDCVDIKIEPMAQDLHNPGKDSSTSATGTNAYPPDDKNLVFGQQSNFNFPNTDSLNEKEGIKKFHAADCEYFNTNQNCSNKVECSISTIQGLQDPCTYPFTLVTETNDYPPDDKSFVFEQTFEFLPS